MSGTENVLAESVGVPMETVSVLLVLVAPGYWFVAACVAVNVAVPVPNNVINPVVGWIDATVLGPSAGMEYTRTWPDRPLTLVFNRAPIATMVPSDESATLYPLLSPAASPSISVPRLTHAKLPLFHAYMRT